MGPLGVQETVFIFVLALLIFGPKKLPELGKTIGKAMSEFRRASSELKATFDREMNAIERENESLKDVTRQYALEEHSLQSRFLLRFRRLRFRFVRLQFRRPNFSKRIRTSGRRRPGGSSPNGSCR